MVGMMPLLKLLAGFFAGSVQNDFWASWVVIDQFRHVVNTALNHNPYIVLIVMLGNFFPCEMRVLLSQ